MPRRACPVRLARRTRLAAAPLAALALLATVARAGQVEIDLAGKVLVLAHIGNINAEQQLAAKGVVAGTPATLHLVLEDGTPGMPVVVTPSYSYLQYDMAIVDVVLSAGTWQAHFAPPAGKESTNFVQVSDEADYIGFDFDGWSGTALGVDTDNILSVGGSPAYGTFFLHFTNSPPIAATDGDLVQDFKLYKEESSAKFFGPGGTITVDFTKAPAGPEAALARQGQLKAAAKLGSSLLKGLGKLTAAGPDGDPLGTAQELLVQDVVDTFGTDFTKAITKAAKKGGSAPLGDSGKPYAADYLVDGLQVQADAIIAGLDDGNAVDRTLRGKILKALAAESRAEFLAQSKFVANSDLVKLANALFKARTRLEQAVGKAVDQAGKQGLPYFGPGAADISASLEPFVESFVDLTSTGL